MAGEAVDGAHSVVATIQSAITLLGLGSLQMLVAGGAFAGLLALLGLPIAFAIIAGFGLGLSSTAVVIGLIRERARDPAGRYVSRSAGIEKFVDTVFAALERERRLPVPGLADDDVARAA